MVSAALIQVQDASLPQYHRKCAAVLICLVTDGILMKFV